MRASHDDPYVWRGPMLIWLTLVQATSASPPARIDLMAPAASKSCTAEDGADVVVCGARDDPYRLRPLPPVADGSAIPKAETGIGNAKAAVETEQTSIGGIPSNRVMLRFKLPF